MVFFWTCQNEETWFGWVSLVLNHALNLTPDSHLEAPQVAKGGKEPTSNAEDRREPVLSLQNPRGGNGQPPEKIGSLPRKSPADRGAWPATVRGKEGVRQIETFEQAGIYIHECVAGT